MLTSKAVLASRKNSLGFIVGDFTDLWGSAGHIVPKGAQKTQRLVK